ncbi:hypothetical protein ANN_02391 [Periplaneta americana]|uniref:Uncharacterized protein n=1 Tax=Periplaneta americana TaxID=6978 RepID=A0ABQ8TW49_PERAM|nr:hypothetical protein ANN_02391 [Periplaneta americana]
MSRESRSRHGCRTAVSTLQVSLTIRELQNSAYNRFRFDLLENIRQGRATDRIFNFQPVTPYVLPITKMARVVSLTRQHKFQVLAGSTGFLLPALLIDHTPLPVNLEELNNRIRAAVARVDRDMLQRVWQELDYRVDVCRVTRGGHIEHL